MLYRTFHVTTTFHFFVREINAEVDEADLLYNLQKTLGKQIIDVDKLENAMREN